MKTNRREFFALLLAAIAGKTVAPAQVIPAGSVLQLTIVDSFTADIYGCGQTCVIASSDANKFGRPAHAESAGLSCRSL